jgi:Domain of unknown function (DUF4159)
MTFAEGIRNVYPEKEIVDLDQSESIFGILNQVDIKVQVPGMQYMRTGRTYEQQSDPYPRWRAIKDDKGRVVVAICHNMDLGDAWEHADDAWYPAEMTGLAYRIAINYFVYDFTH